MQQPFQPPMQPGMAVPPPLTARDRVLAAASPQAREQSDYIFDFWTALGWTLLSCGLYGIYTFYQLVRRSRDHNLRRIEVLDAATTYAWERAGAQGLADELRPHFDRIGMSMSVLRSQTTEFRDPVIWAVLGFVAGGIAQLVAYVLLDGDLVKHDAAETAIEHELAAIFGRLGAPLTPAPHPPKEPHNYVGRILATIGTCGFYGLWWLYDMYEEGNEHFRRNWYFEDGLAAAVHRVG